MACEEPKGSEDRRVSQKGTKEKVTEEKIQAKVHAHKKCTGGGMILFSIKGMPEQVEIESLSPLPSVLSLLPTVEP